MINPDTILALYGAGEAQDQTGQISESELPPPTSDLSFAAYIDGVLQNVSLAGVANEISVTIAGTVVTIAFDAAFILKGVTTAAQLRTAAGLGTMATRNQIAASADAAGAVSAGYVQAEVQAILDELRDLKTKARTSGALAT